MDFFQLMTDWMHNIAKQAAIFSKTSDLVFVTLILAFSFLSFFITRRYLSKGVARLFRSSNEKVWLKEILKANILSHAAYLMPAFVISFGLQYYPESQVFLSRVIYAYIIANMILLIAKALNLLTNIYQSYEISQKKPIKGYVQLSKIFLYGIGIILVICKLLDTSPWGFLTGLGVVSSVLLFIFKDTILSFIASIQLISNDLIRKGDWIEFAQFDANGSVIDVALHVIKIQNFDKTISTIPTYKFMEGSFKNWRGMFDSGGRRIRRSILIDQKSIHFLTNEELERLRKIKILQPYIDSKLNEIPTHIQGRPGVEDLNERRLTNIGTFRAYIEAYLASNPKIHKEMLCMVRQLDPTPDGIPMQIYAFTSDTLWTNHENIQSDIFDHLLAASGLFGIKIFQNPSGSDIKVELTGKKCENTLD